MADDNFKTLDGIYQMFTPSDLVGKPIPNLGGPLEKLDNAFVQLLSILENNGRGVRSIDDVVSRIEAIKGKSDGTVDLSQYLTIWTSKNVVDLGAQTAKDKVSIGADGSPKNLSSLKDVIGPDFQFPEGATVHDLKASVVLSKSPFFNPSTRNTRKAEVFLNSMPSTVLAQLVPYMQIEFQFTRDPSPELQTLGQLKLLMGAANKSTLSVANKVMAEGHQVTGDKDKKVAELDFVGMEAFTSPITLTDPQPNKDVSTRGNRYVDVIDPFRPFATVEHVSISAKPSGAGFYCYKKANLSLKVHDRSRLNEISDLLRPRVYTGVTIWLTYGWRAPVRSDSNPYFSYVNDNMMMREAYHIVNSSFSFDPLGQVTINLELFTKGVPELRDLKITDNATNDKFRMGQVKRLQEQISHYRQALRLDSPEGINKEIRVFQVLDAAETGEFPDTSSNDVRAKIDSLQKALNQTQGIDKDALTGLITAMKELYRPDTADPRKFAYKQRYERLVTDTVAKLFKEVRTGDDPFLPGEGKGLGAEVTKMVSDHNGTPATKVDKQLKRYVSFGKVFSVFALRAILSIPETIDEVQVFFYNLNSQCGPISGHSIAEFPIDMAQFIDQFNDLAKQKGGEKITLEDFLSLCINGQFLDNRSLGYGLTQYYEPYAKGKDAQLKSGKDNEAAFENKLAAYSNKYGPFRKPVVEMYVECSHQMVDEEGQGDILQLLNYSAKDADTVSLQDARGHASKRIMRIHVYDKQTDAYAHAAPLLRNVNNTGFISVNPNIDDRFKQYKPRPEDTFDSYKKALGVTLAEDQADGTVKITDLGSYATNQQIKDIVSKLVPTIRFGTNGTTIKTANLSSKADPLLSTVQMIRSQTIKNTAAPNGSGDLGLPLRVIPAQLTMPSWGNPLATMAQMYFIDFQTGTTLDNLYIVTGLTHEFAPGKFDTTWQLGYADGYGVYEGAPNIVDQIAKVRPDIPKDPSNV